MNAGLFEQAYGAPLKPARVRYYVGTGSSRYFGEAVVLGTSDNMSGATIRYKGGGNAVVDRTDLVLQVPVTLGRQMQAVAGAGALMLQIPDGTAFGGNDRGMGAIDFQIVRSSPLQVAGGNYAQILGGSGNTANGQSAVIVGGYGHLASSSYSVVGGGNANTAGGASSVVAGGSSNNASAGNSVISGGIANISNGLYSTIPGGSSASARGGVGAFAYASGSFGTTGDAQTKMHVLRRLITGALSNQPLYADGATNTAGYHIELPNDSTYAIEATVVARRTDVDGESAGWTIRAVVDRGTAASTIRLVGTPTVTENGRDAALNASVSCAVDTTLGVLKILATVTDTGKTVRFVAQVQTVEVVG